MVTKREGTVVQNPIFFKYFSSLFLQFGVFVDSSLPIKLKLQCNGTSKFVIMEALCVSVFSIIKKIGNNLLVMKVTQ